MAYVTKIELQRMLVAKDQRIAELEAQNALLRGGIESYSDTIARWTSRQRGLLHTRDYREARAHFDELSKQTGRKFQLLSGSEA